MSNLTQPKRYLAHSATFSRMATVKEVYDFLSQRLRIRPEDMRLWHFKDEVICVIRSLKVLSVALLEMRNVFLCCLRFCTCIRIPTEQHDSPRR